MNLNYPKFSFLIICYNQEKYIATALNSALQQNYPELEIIVSDDNSSDRTFEIATEIAQNYHGPFRIILHKNQRNLGIGANFHQAYALSSGDWLFMAAGDDVSLPNRCSLIAGAIADNPGSLCFGSYREIIDGNDLGMGYSYWNDMVHGAAAVWHRTLFSSFPPIPENIMSEDHVLYFRVFILGGKVTEIQNTTIRYRIDGNSISNLRTSTYWAAKEHFYKKVCIYARILQVNQADLLSHPCAPQCLNRMIESQFEKVHRVKATLEEELSLREKPFLKKLHYLLFKNKFHSKLTHRFSVFLIASCPLIVWRKKNPIMIDGQSPSPLGKAKYWTYSIEDYCNEPRHRPF